MGEFTRANGQGKSFFFAVKDIFTAANFTIAIISSLIGYVVIEYLRKKVFWYDGILKYLFLTKIGTKLIKLR